MLERASRHAQARGEGRALERTRGVREIAELFELRVRGEHVARAIEHVRFEPRAALLQRRGHGHVHPAQERKVTHRVADAVRLVRPTTVRMGGQKRGVRLDQKLLGRHQEGCLTQRTGVAEGHRAGEGQHVSGVHAGAGELRVPGEAVEDHCGR